MPPGRSRIVGATGAGKTSHQPINRFYGGCRQHHLRWHRVRLIARMICAVRSPSYCRSTVHRCRGQHPLWKLDASMEVVRAAKLANADSFIRRLPGV
ncbi:MAG: hypothetical protein ACLVJ6_10345 [Merdibacter sp.]